jgi:hypothetical protein
VSPNGKYVFYVEKNDDYNLEAALNVSNAKNTKHNIKTSKIVGRVSEIISLRPKKDTYMIERIKKQAKKLRGIDKKEKMDRLLEINDVVFSLKPIRSVASVGHAIGIDRHHDRKKKDIASKLFVTNYGDVIYMDKDNDILHFNDADLIGPSRNKFGNKPNSKEKNDMRSLSWAFGQKGVIAYTEESAYFLGIRMILGKTKAKKVMKIKFQINSERLKVKNIHGCPNPNYILIAMTNIYDEIILLIWDLVKNTEKYNYSVVGEYSYISKPNSEFGIILCKDYYINLDVGLINYYFDHDFSTYPWTDNDQGFKMDRSEKTILYKGKLLMKEMYSECETLQSLLDGRMVYSERNMSCKFYMCLFLF